MIHVSRLGFAGTDADGYDGPELALEAALRHMEGNGHTIVSVSVGRSFRDRERYEVFVVSRELGPRQTDVSGHVMQDGD